MARSQIRTAGRPAQIILKADESGFPSNWEGVCFVRAIIVDANGVRVPRADNMLEFSVAGPGIIAATENGDRNDDEPFQSNRHRAYDGRCVAIVKASDPKGGIVFVNAGGAGLAPALIPVWAVTSR